MRVDLPTQKVWYSQAALKGIEQVHHVFIVAALLSRFTRAMQIADSTR